MWPSCPQFPQRLCRKWLIIIRQMQETGVRIVERVRALMGLTVVSGLVFRLSVRGVPPSLAILAFFLCKRRSWFFFIRAISSSSLRGMKSIRN